MRPATFVSRRRPSALVNLRDIQQLLDECTASLQTDPTCLHTLAIRAHASMKAKLYDMAICDFSEILQRRPDDIHARFSRGMALFKSAQIERAHADFSRVLELNPHHVMARYARAGCFNTEGEFHEAILEYTIALEHDEKENESGLRMDQFRHLSEFRDTAAAAAVSKRSLLLQQYAPPPPDNKLGSSSLRRQELVSCAPVPSALRSSDPSPITYARLHGGSPHSSDANQSQHSHSSVRAPPSSPSSTTSQATTAPPLARAPRRVVQVRVNLSEFAESVPTASTLAPAEQSSITTTALQRTTRTQCASWPVAPEGTEYKATSALDSSVPPSLPVTTSGAAVSMTSGPAPRPAPLRAVRKVTVTL